MSLENLKTPILKRGVTGFDPSLPVHDSEAVLKVFKLLQYPFVKNGALNGPHQSANYFRLTVLNTVEKDRFDVLINGRCWLMAGIKPESTWMQLQFIDLPISFKKLFQSISFLKIFDATVMNRTVPKKELECLGVTELKQITYWNSKTYGDIIFNGYD